MNNEHKIIIAGGGTGGHVFPAIAIARALQRKDRDIEILFVGAKGKMEMQKVPEAGFEIEGLDIAGMNRSSILKNLTLPFKVLRSLSQAGKIIKRFKPDVVVGVGGYASFPVLYKAQTKKIPTVIQEQNSFAGKTNKILGEKAKKICVASKGMERFFPVERIVFTGNPVRKNILHANIMQVEALKDFGLKGGKKTVFIVGGSQGAKAINDALLVHLEQIVNADVQMIWQTGKVSYDEVMKKTERYSGTIKPFKFLTEIEKAYAAADVIVSRAGAIALAELSIAGKPVIFVPLPTAAEDHQFKNAKSFVEADAALMVKNGDAEEHLVEMLIQLLQDEKKILEMRKNIKKLAVENADEKIAAEILKLL
ncbi:MAG TPA: undecaprenyldiphospho-muramoylpentapeptide beta-N-acetylglucosaminyltransferase [Chitinophagaceae bacterium]|nr:undecaprenyldiphospho-muramoylpentapeptide beta-N-acetylglucosaminyltransferase [Chitinophagaceae bacterium]